MKWIRKKRYRDTGCASNELVRCYGVEGGLYPRLVISIYKCEHTDTIDIGINVKEYRNSWWNRTSLPIYLIEDLTELLEEYRIKFKYKLKMP